MAGRKRNKGFLVRLNEKEMEELDHTVSMTKLSRESYIRNLINGYKPKAAPSKELIEILKQLRKIGVNMNQIAHQANATGIIDEAAYKNEYEDLQNQIDQIMMLII